MAKNKFSKDWIHQHINDPYVKMAQQKGYRARAAFKLIEILDTEKLLRRGDLVVDLGSAPGSWSQVCLLYTSGWADASQSSGRDVRPSIAALACKGSAPAVERVQERELPCWKN